MVSRILAAAVLCALVGCAAPVFNPATNEPLSAATPPNMGAPTDHVRENAIVLSFSGGGLRAAAFAHGVLAALRSVKTPEGDLLDDVALISSVSGSSLTAAYYGLYGRQGLDRFAEDVLLPGFEHGMRLALNPGNLLRMFAGGINAREDFGDELDRRVFRGARFGDMYARPGPEIRIHATDLYNRIAFPFTPTAFYALCSDLSRYSVADAVAASMAVPMLFAPMVVRTFPEACQPVPVELHGFLKPKPEAPRGIKALANAARVYRDKHRPRYIKLADGGLTDNAGVSTLVNDRAGLEAPHAPLTAHEAVTVRRLLVVVVDASAPPGGDWSFDEPGPSGLDLALAGTDASIDSAARLAADALGGMIEQFQKAVVAFRCGLSREEVDRLGGPAAWDCADVKIRFAYLATDDLPSPARERIQAIPTRLSLPREDIEAAGAAGREAALALPGLRAYAGERVAPSSR